MKLTKGNDPGLLLLGDIFFWTLALWLALFARYLHLPDTSLFLAHFFPFLFIFFCWAVVFFISNLYAPFVGFFRKQLVGTILRAQIINSVFAVAFFYFFPSFGISPKTVLLIDLGFSLCLVALWRLAIVPVIFRKDRERVMLLGHGDEIEETKRELKKNPYYFELVEPDTPISPADTQSVEHFIDEREVGIVLANFRDEEVEKAASRLYNSLFTQVRFVSLERIYEELFGRVSLALISDGWILENISYRTKPGYMILKRLMDIVIGFVAGVLSLLLYPFIILAIKLDDGGAIFISQERVGKDGEVITLHKFRSMSRNETDLESTTENRVTRVGNFLRTTRLDELPQLWSVVRGDLSLIGPRPELVSGVSIYDKEIPYYNIRHLIEPGLSGWAQIHQENHPHHALALKATEDKLSYDIYYLKNRSLVLDLKIALKTLKTVFSRSGK